MQRLFECHFSRAWFPWENGKGDYKKWIEIHTDWYMPGVLKQKYLDKIIVIQEIDIG